MKAYITFILLAFACTLNGQQLTQISQFVLNDYAINSAVAARDSAVELGS